MSSFGKGKRKMLKRLARRQGYKLTGNWSFDLKEIYQAAGTQQTGDNGMLHRVPGSQNKHKH